MDPITRPLMMASGGLYGPYWFTSVAHTYNHQAMGIAVDSEGCAYVCGFSTLDSGSTKMAISLVKLDPAGAVRWQRWIGGSSSKDLGQSVAVDTGGNAIVAGYLDDGTSDEKGWLGKFNSSGTLLWQRTLSGSGIENICTVRTDSSSNIYVLGTTDSEGAGSGDAVIAKYNSSGTIQWQRSLGGSGVENTSYRSLMYVDGSGNIWVTFKTLSEGNGGDIAVAKYNTSGVIQWQKRLDDSNTNAPTAITVDGSGNIYIGHTYGSSPTKPAVVKLNSSGAIQWQRCIISNIGTGNNTIVDMAVDRDGYIYAVGSTNGIVAGGINEGFIIKFDSNYTVQWSRGFGATNYSTAFHGIGFNAFGDMMICARHLPSGGTISALVFRLPADGSKMGTYGSSTYTSRSWTWQTTTSLTAYTSTLTDAARTLSDAAGSRTDQASTMTSSVTIM